MRLIHEFSTFDHVNRTLDTIGGRLIVSLESYSCKFEGEKQALYKKFSRRHDPVIFVQPTLSHAKFICSSTAVSPTPSRLSDSGGRLSDSGGAVSLSSPAEASDNPSRETLSVVQPTLSRLGDSGGAVSVSSPAEASDNPSRETLSAEVEGLAAEFGGEDAIPRKTLFYLISTLNTAFYPDYDFSNAASTDFSRQHSLQQVMVSVESQLSVLSQSQLAGQLHTIWKAVDDTILLSDCQLYTYNPDGYSDPFSEKGCGLSFNYLFYNPRLMRIIFFMCCHLAYSGDDATQPNSFDYYNDCDTDFDD